MALIADAPRRQTAGLVDTVLIIVGNGHLIAQAFLVALAIVIVGCLFLPHYYTATSIVLPPQRRQVVSTSLGLLIQRVAGVNDPNAENPADIFVVMLKSRTIEDNIIGRFDLLHVYDCGQQCARQDLARNTEILVTKEGLISISVRDRDRVRAADIANAYVGELRNLLQRLSFETANKRRLFYENQLKVERIGLFEAEAATQLEQERTSLLAPGPQELALIESAEKLRRQIIALKVQLRAMQTSFTAENPEVRLVEAELAGLELQLMNLQHASSPTSEINGNLAGNALPNAEMGYRRNFREIQIHRGVEWDLRQELESAELNESPGAISLQVIDVAKPAETFGEPRTAMLLATVTTVFLATCLWIFCLETLRLWQKDPRWTCRMDQLWKSLGFHRAPTF